MKRKSERHVELKRCDSAIHNLPTHTYTRRNIRGICGWHNTHAINIGTRQR